MSTLPRRIRLLLCFLITFQVCQIKSQQSDSTTTNTPSSSLFNTPTSLTERQDNFISDSSVPGSQASINFSGGQEPSQSANSESQTIKTGTLFFAITQDTFRPITPTFPATPTTKFDSSLITVSTVNQPATLFAGNTATSTTFYFQTQFTSFKVYTTPAIIKPITAPTGFINTTPEKYNDTDIDMQIIFTAIYSQLPTNITNEQDKLALTMKNIVNIPTFNQSRIENIAIKQSTIEGEVLLTFTILSEGNTYPTARDAATSLSNSINLRNNPPIVFSNGAILYTGRGVCWTDYITCKTPCSKKCFVDHRCNHYCADQEQVFTPPSSYNSGGSNNNLLGLIAIPSIILLVAIVTIIALVMYRRPNANKSAIELNEFGYADTIGKYGTGTVRKQNGLTIAEPGNRNRVYSTMGRSFEMGWDMHGNSKEVDDDDDDMRSQKF